MSQLYQQCHRELQDRYQSRLLADMTEKAIYHEVFTQSDKDFIEGADMFFVSSVSPTGQPTVSHKGGVPGFVRIHENTIVFPIYDGNGMFLSTGNLTATAKVGLLFIDLERPRRLRIHGLATLDESEAGKASPGALFSVRVIPSQIFVNCPQYISRYQRISTSKYAPSVEDTPPMPQWKRLNFIQDGLRDAEKAAVEELGTISQQEYDAKVLRGDG